MAHVLILVVDGFRDEELFEPMNLLTQAGHQATLASTSLATCTGMLGGSVEPDTTLDQITVEPFDLLMIPGGEGTPSLRRHPRTIELVKAFDQAGKPIAAICWAPTILAIAGVLTDVNATVCQLQEPDEFAPMNTTELLKANGATPHPGPIVRADRILTANGPSAAVEFSQQLLELINHQPSTES